MGSPFDDLALLQHDDLVAVADRAEAVRDDDAGAAAPPQIVIDDLFGDRIERAGRFVEHDQRGIGNQRPRDLDSLALAAAEIGAAFVDVAVVVSRPRRDVLVDRGVLQRLRKVGLGDGRVPQGQVFARRSLEQEDVLVDIGDRVCKHLRRNLRQAPSVDADFARPRLVEPANQLSERRLPAAGSADKGHPRSRLDADRDAVEQRRLEDRSIRT